MDDNIKLIVIGLCVGLLMLYSYEIVSAYVITTVYYLPPYDEHLLPRMCLRTGCYPFREVDCCV